MLSLLIAIVLTGPEPLTVPLEPYPADPVIQGHKQPPARKRSEFEKLLPAKFTPHQHGPGGESLPSPTVVHSPMRIVLCAAPTDGGVQNDSRPHYILEFP